MAGQKKSQRFLKCVKDSFLTQVIEEPTRIGATLDLELTNKEEMVGNAVLQGTVSDNNGGDKDPQGSEKGTQQNHCPRHEESRPLVSSGTYSIEL